MIMVFHTMTKINTGMDNLRKTEVLNEQQCLSDKPLAVTYYAISF